MPHAETVAEIARGIAAGERSAEETAREFLDRIERTEPRIRAFISVDGDRAVSRARKIDAARAAGEALGPLAGVPIAIKDNICMQTGVTTAGRLLSASWCSRRSWPVRS